MADWRDSQIRYLVHFSDGGSGVRYFDARLVEGDTFSRARCRLQGQATRSHIEHGGTLACLGRASEPVGRTARPRAAKRGTKPDGREGPGSVRIVGVFVPCEVHDGALISTEASCVIDDKRLRISGLRSEEIRRCGCSDTSHRDVTDLRPEKLLEISVAFEASFGRVDDKAILEEAEVLNGIGGRIGTLVDTIGSFGPSCPQ